MTLRSSIWDLLPSTNRNFESRISHLQERLDALSEREGRLELLLQESIEREKQLETILYQIQEKSLKNARYANAEYAALATRSSARNSGVLIAGWYGASNCGDEIMLRTVLQRFEGSPLPITVLLWDDYDYRFDSLPGWVETIHYPKSTWDIRLLAAYYETLVWGGGAILDDNQFNGNPDNVNTGNLFIRLSEMMIGKGKDVYAIGLSSNTSFSSPEYCRRLNDVIKGCKHFSVRDPYSYSALDKCGVDVSRVVLCEDIALANRNIVIRPTSQKGIRHKVAFAPLCFEPLYEHNMHVINLIHSELSALGADHEICLVPFCNEKGSDEWYLNRMLDELKRPSWISLGAYSSEINESEIVSSDLAVCYRYHASLIALAYNIPLIACCYNKHAHYPNKMRHAVELFREEDSLMMYDELEDNRFTQKIKELATNPKEQRLCTDLLEGSRAYLDALCNEICHQNSTY